MIKRKLPIGKIVQVIVIGLLSALLIAENIYYMELRQEYVQSKKKAQEYLDDYKNRNNDYEELNKNYEELNKNYEELNNSYENLNSDYENLNSLYMTLEGMYTELKTENEKLGSQVDRQDEELQTLLEKQSEAEVHKDGMLSPSAGSSVFSEKKMTPGSIITIEKASDWDTYYCIDTISRDGEVFSRINGKSYRDNDNISLEELRYLKFLHYNFDHEIQVGEMIVNAAIAEDVRNVFRELFYLEYEIESIYLVDNYWVDGEGGNTADYNSIEHNNTSCFNYRAASGGSNLSQHAYGRAIDINPQQNPYISNGICYHENASQYVDRSSGDPHVIVRGDDCYNIFENYGFSWGGAWSEPIDYQHFEKRAG